MVYDNYHPDRRNKFQAETTKAFYYEIAPHVATKTKRGDLGLVRARMACILDLSVLGWTSASTWIEEDGTVKNEAQTLPPMPIVRYSLAFSSGMEGEYITRSRIAPAKFQQATGESKVDLNDVCQRLGVDGDQDGNESEESDSETDTEEDLKTTKEITKYLTTISTVCTHLRTFGLRKISTSVIKTWSAFVSLVDKLNIFEHLGPQDKTTKVASPKKAVSLG